MQRPIKRVAAIHDLSGFGRSSLSVIIPVLSTMGIQVCSLPTSILSTHTKGFKDFSFIDLSDSMVNSINHWDKENIEFDCIYSGFLGSEKQVDIIIEFINKFKTSSNLVVVDPVMGDDGKFYPTMNKSIVKKMKVLIQNSDIIIPNFTEAMLLLEKPYCDCVSEKEIKNMLIGLSELGPEIVVITSVMDNIKSEDISVFAYDKRNNKYLKITSKYIPVQYPGTGDTFASVLIGSLLNGESLSDSLNKSVNFIIKAIKESQKSNSPIKEGILLEKVLGTLRTN